MPRAPRNEVAANKTITMRVTEADKARFERQIEARAADLPERTMTALLRRLVQDSEEGPFGGLPADERAMLDGLVRDRAEELHRLGVYEARVTPTSVMVGLIRDAAKARGILASAAPITGPAAKAPPKEPPGKAPAEHVAGPDASSVHAALLVALENGATQAGIAKRAGIDSGQLSRFKREGSGLSPESMTKLARAIE